jgi:hypothetical protein
MKRHWVRRISRALVIAAGGLPLFGCGAAEGGEAPVEVGETAQEFRAGIDIADTGGLISDYTADNQRVFYSYGPRSSCSTLGRVSLIKTAPYFSPGSSVTAVYGQGCDRVDQVLSDGTWVYYKRGTNIWKVTATGYDVAESLVTPPSFVFANETAFTMTQDANNLYWVTSAGIRKKAKSAGTFDPATTIYAPLFGQELRVLGSDGTHVFFHENFFGFTSIRKIPVNGGTEVTLRMFALDRFMTGFSMSSNHVFVAEAVNNNRKQSAIWRTDKNGNGFAFVTQQQDAQAIAVTVDEAGKVYWVNWDAVRMNGPSTIRSRTNPFGPSGTFKTESTRDGIMFAGQLFKPNMPIFHNTRAGGGVFHGLVAFELNPQFNGDLVWYVFD